MNKLMKKSWLAICCICILSISYATETQEMMLRISGVTSASKQSQMTPKEALVRLKEGNQRFLSHTNKQRDYLAQAKQSSYGQFPWAVILSCMDSRSVPELIFDQGLADLFVLRVAGNVLNDDILGSMEYAAKGAGSRLIVVLGHTSCGAVTAACQDIHFGHLDNIINKIQPVVIPSKKETGTDNCSKSELISAIAKNNALSVARKIQEQSPILRDLIANGKVGIVAGMHDIRTGKVTFFEERILFGSQDNIIGVKHEK